MSVALFCELRLGVVVDDINYLGHLCPNYLPKGWRPDPWQGPSQAFPRPTAALAPGARVVSCRVQTESRAVPGDCCEK